MLITVKVNVSTYEQQNKLITEIHTVVHMYICIHTIPCRLKGNR